MVSDVNFLEDMVPFEADEKLRLAVPEGLLGFDEYKEYILFGSRELSPFRVLQSLDEPTVIFVVVEPHLFFKGYDVELSHSDAQSLNLSSLSEAVVLAILVVPQDPLEMTANLLAPLVVNVRERIAKQVVLHKSPHSVRERVFPDIHPTQFSDPLPAIMACATG